MKNKIKKILNKTISKKSYQNLALFYGLMKTFYVSTFFKTRRFININNGGFKIMIDPKNGYTDKMLYLERSRDKYVTDVLDKYLTKGSVFVDIGMNIGYETLWGAKIVGETGKVISFEPLAFLVEQVKESLKVNNFKNVEIVNKALGIKEEKLKIFLTSADAGLSSLVNSENSNREENIDVSTLDKELKDLTRLDLIKIDVEGYEYEVLVGGNEIIAKFLPAVIFEFTSDVYEKAYIGKSADILKYFIRLNYKLKTEIDGKVVIISEENIEKFTRTESQKKSILNILAFQ